MDERKFKVNTDEEFFSEFLILQSRIRDLSGMFQNEGAVITGEAYDEWMDYAEEVHDDFEKLIRNADSNFVSVRNSK